MKILTLRVGDAKTHIVNFDKDQTIVDQYIIPQFEGESTAMGFYLMCEDDYADGVVFQMSDGEKALYIKSIASSCDRRQDGDFRCVDIQIEINLSLTQPKETIVEGCVELTKEGRVCYTTLGTRDTTHIIAVKLNYESVMGRAGNERTEILTHQMKLLSTTRAHIADVVLDFGSEASQVLVERRDRAMVATSIIPLFDKIKNRYMAGDNTDSSKFVQYSPPSVNGLYLSKFLIPTSVDRAMLANMDYKPSNEPSKDKMLEFLIKKEKLEEMGADYVNLPNVKIANFGTRINPRISIKDELGSELVYMDQIRNNFFYRYAINLFIHQAFKEVATRNWVNIEPSNNIYFVSFLVLMPNVYSHSEMLKNLNNLKADIQEMIDSQYGFVKGFELSAVSESDASLLGALEVNANLNVESGNYLIMDAGKGTLDFSIMKYSADADRMCYQNLCRSGIIGAGNAISYGVLLSVLRDMFEGLDSVAAEDRMRNLIHSRILGLTEDGRKNKGGDPKYILDLVEALDRYKRSIKSEDNYMPTEEDLTDVYDDDVDLDELDEITIEGVINTINSLTEGRFFATDKHNHIKNVIDRIVHDMFVALDETRRGGMVEIDNYIFAGRGFLFKPFRDAVEAQLKKRFPEAREVKYLNRGVNTADPKSVCMYIVNTIKNGYYNTSNIGKPFLMEPYDESSPRRNNNGFMNRVGQALNFRRALGQIRDVVLPGGNLCFHDPEDSENPLVYGYVFSNTYNSDKINLGGVTYRFPRALMDSQIEIFYDGEQYYIRSEGRIVDFDNVPNIKDHFVFESMFPYCNGEVSDICVNHEIEKEQEEQENEES